MADHGAPTDPREKIVAQVLVPFVGPDGFGEGTAQMRLENAKAAARAVFTALVELQIGPNQSKGLESEKRDRPDVGGHLRKADEAIRDIDIALDAGERCDTTAREWTRWWCEGCGQFCDSDYIDIDGLCAGCGTKTEKMRIREVRSQTATVADPNPSPASDPAPSSSGGGVEDYTELARCIARGTHARDRQPICPECGFGRDEVPPRDGRADRLGPPTEGP